MSAEGVLPLSVAERIAVLREIDAIRDDFQIVLRRFDILVESCQAKHNRIKAIFAEYEECRRAQILENQEIKIKIETFDKLFIEYLRRLDEKVNENHEASIIMKNNENKNFWKIISFTLAGILMGYMFDKVF